MLEQPTRRNNESVAHNADYRHGANVSHTPFYAALSLHQPCLTPGAPAVVMPSIVYPRGNVRCRTRGRLKRLWILGACLAACIGALSAAKATPTPIGLNAVPAATAVAVLDRTLHARILLDPRIDPNRLVSLYVSATPSIGRRQRAVVALARQLGADYEKLFIVTKTVGATSAHRPSIDEVASITFNSRHMTARQAMMMVAGSDRASINFHSPVHGYVTLSTNTLTLREAAKEIAAQTHTTWTTVYRIYPSSRQFAPTMARVIGHTPLGGAITELPPDGPLPAGGLPAGMYAHRTMDNAVNNAAAPAGVTTSTVPPNTTPYTDPYGAVYSSGAGSNITLPDGNTVDTPSPQLLTPENNYYYPPIVMSPVGQWYTLPNGSTVTGGGGSLVIAP